MTDIDRSRVEAASARAAPNTQIRTLSWLAVKSTESFSVLYRSALGASMTRDIRYLRKSIEPLKQSLHSVLGRRTKNMDSGSIWCSGYFHGELNVPMRRIVEDVER